MSNEFIPGYYTVKRIPKPVDVFTKHQNKILRQMLKSNGEKKLYVYNVRNGNAEVAGSREDGLLGTAVIPVNCLSIETRYE